MEIYPINMDFVRPSTVKAAKAFYNELRDEIQGLLRNDAVAPRFLENHLKLMELVHSVAFPEEE